jgi:hypothetical protein
LVMREGTLTSVAWGLFIILIGGLWIVADITKLNVSSYFALGVGLILIGLNLARPRIGVKMSKFSLGLGIVALLVGFSGVGGLMLPLIPTIIVVIGLFIVAEAVAKMGPS